MFNKKIIIAILFLFLTSSVCLISNAVDNSMVTIPGTTIPKPADVTCYKEVLPVNLVAQPSKYLGKKIKMEAKFDKFSTIGLDYPPVKRDAKTYISFLIKRDNVTTYNIPLSELKLIVKRNYAEKELVNIEQGDAITIYGTVFSTALGDPWVDVEKIKLHVNRTAKKDK